MNPGTLASATAEVSSAGAPAEEPRPSVRSVVVAQFGFVWRLLRHMGVPPSDVDDAAQQVFLVASSKLERVLPGHERSFLYAVAMRVASKTRRAARLRADREVDPLELRDCSPNPEEQLDAARKRALLESLLDAMEDDVRAVFVLHEIEQFTMSEIATTLEIAPGTVASRLRRARVEFHEHLQRYQARRRSKGGLP